VESRSSSPTLRDCLLNLSRLLDEPGVDRDAQWYEALNNRLGELEQALGDSGAGPERSASLTEIRRSHPRLISRCAEFQRDGRELLRRATLIVRLSARNYDAGKAPYTELRAATESLIDAAEKYLEMEADLNEEVGRDIGGEG